MQLEIMNYILHRVICHTVGIGTIYYNPLKQVTAI